MASNIEVNYSDDTHMKSGVFHTLFHGAIWNLIPILHCPFKDMREVKIYLLKHLDIYLRICPLQSHILIYI